MDQSCFLIALSGRIGSLVLLVEVHRTCSWIMALIASFSKIAQAHDSDIVEAVANNVLVTNRDHVQAISSARVTAIITSQVVGSIQVIIDIAHEDFTEDTLSVEAVSTFVVDITIASTEAISVHK